MNLHFVLNWERQQFGSNQEEIAPGVAGAWTHDLLLGATALFPYFVDAKGSFQF